ncbi:MAG TPA: multifunctional oxoglutarate decarboxylase/oxoglutarate dehydrogenase thiamine pyrophosphate-binding subunit/dihydrolipoyllysine-residue succinyltransferase subunit [Acidimicrobiales bacterium]|nr:multifunctional oxoglutarate decarboxylase/oxoglutarate dehydrogenase thiamine pyrophosphate-binding subunit/dihydrolipoyllysine-residue succinyltransferase subunit [Acidimicrobiales bacterium]
MAQPQNPRPDHARQDPARPEALGPNAWLVDEMFDQFRRDPTSVSESWQEFFAGYRPGGANLGRPVVVAEEGQGVVEAARAQSTAGVGGPGTGLTGQSTAGQGSSRGAQASPAGADGAASGAAGAAATGPTTNGANAGQPGAAPGETVPLRGSAARVVANMTTSLEVPTATSFRVVPAKLLEVNRLILNNQLVRTGTAGKVSFTHLIGWAIVQALKSVPAMNASFAAQDGNGSKTPAVFRPAHVNLGLAVDLERADGTRSLVVPVIKQADTLDFRAFWLAYEELVRKVRAGKADVSDYIGATVTITNPGTLGTVQSVPRLMAGQGAIVGVGAIDYPAEWQGADPRQMAELGVSKVVTITSTYDHRVIQGAESGMFLRCAHRLLLGEDGFYEGVFRSMGVPYEAVRYHRDVNDPFERSSSNVQKQQQVDRLVNAYRVRGHLIAHLDPLDWREPHMHAELDPATYGLSVWDLEREFFTYDFPGHDRMRLGDILSMLRDAYCRTIGVEYMHIMEPSQKRWIQEHVEGAPTTLAPDEHRHILSRLNAAEALERFLETKYIGQKRFGLEGAESAIPLLDALLGYAADLGHSHAVMGMAHRGRLNVLINIVGKSYEELFGEFEGNLDPNSVQGSGDVKYHKGFRGTFQSRNGNAIDVVLASNPSHLEAVGPVVEGMARALQDQVGATATVGSGGTGTAPGGAPEQLPAAHQALPVLVHGDAAFAGQGVVAELLNMSALAAYETGGTVHLVINNQLGFTTNPESARSSVYATDVAKMVQAPIFHVNGDDPEACVRVGRLALAFRQEFHKDVVIDMVCYRRYGHNEQDDPSLTQPLLYQLIKDHRSVRKLYTEALVRRGDITLEEAEAALADFSKRLQAALDQTRASAPPQLTQLPTAPGPAAPLGAAATAVPMDHLDKVVAALTNPPEGCTLHPKIAKVLDTRAKLWASGQVDWALGEALAYGTVMLDGHDVRLCGQDTRRGTFGHRNAVYVDFRTGEEHLALAGLSDEGAGPSDEGAGPSSEGARLGDDGAVKSGRFFVYDSLLSEYAALGFEYGYSLFAPDALVAWEAQFGDFVNGAQIIIDQFIVASEAKWEQRSRLVLLLPHGYEGQGPEHSSARVERFLTLCAEDNICVANVTTAGQLFHLLRRQTCSPLARPLVLFTPKRYLRAKEAYSPVEELTGGSFHEVLDDAGVAPEEVNRIVVATGKAALDIIGTRNERGIRDVAVVRLEQLYPWPEQGLLRAIERYPQARTVVWAQEEPANMGARQFVVERLPQLCEGRETLFVSRPASGSPATGSHAMHELEQKDLFDRALGTGVATPAR